MIKKTALASLFLCALCLLTSCDPITRHKVLTTVFDGVPSLPPPEQICTEYADKRVLAYQQELIGKANADKKASSGGESVHEPYREKDCNGCHDRSKESGFIRPVRELCYACHTDFIKGTLVHGPVAVGDCLACHVPHNSSDGPLLKENKGKLCLSCHKEKRIATGLHDSVARYGLVCTDCHDPHFGNVQYFLK